MNRSLITIVLLIMKTSPLALALIIAATTLTANTNLPPVIVTASRIAQPINKAGASTALIDSQELQRNQTRTLPEALATTPGILVQKTANGHGSPFIRGFTGFHNLLLVDGIRLNSTILRSGPNQYCNTVDNNSLERIEVLKGPGSALYGSDAIGGTVQAFTRLPIYAPEGQESWSGRLQLRASSAERSIVGRTELGYSTDSIAALFGFTYKNFGDLQGGKHVRRQRKTGYDELNFDGKLRLALDSDREFVLAHYNVDQDDIWRTHRTPYGISWSGTTIGSEPVHKFNQDRTLSYLRYLDTAPTALYDDLQATLYYQTQKEKKTVVSKAWDRTDDGFSVKTWGANINLIKESDYGTWAYGAEYLRDAVTSFRTVYNPDGSIKSIGLQGPVADDSYYHMAGIYLQNRLALSDRWDLTAGGRATYARADVGAFENVNTAPHSLDSLDESWTDASGFARLSYEALQDHAWIYTSASQGFRAPGLSDLTRFDVARTDVVSYPSPDVDPLLFILGHLRK